MEKLSRGSAAWVVIMTVVVALTSTRSGAQELASADWPARRGPNGNSSSPITGIRKDWTGGLKKVWEVKGLSPDTCTWSPPSIQKNKLIVMGQRDEADGKSHTNIVFCYDADKGGEPLWKTEFPDSYDDYGWGTGPATMPTMDGDKVYVAGRVGQVLCLNLADGKKLWETEACAACHGYSASSLVWEDLLIVPGLKGPAGFSLVGAVKKDTGAVVWNYKQAAGGDNPAYGHVSPAKVTIKGVEQILYSTGTLACGLDPRTGKAIWEFPIEKGWGGNYTPAGPIAVGNALFLSTSDAKPPMGIEVEGESAKQLWKGYVGGKDKYGQSLSQGIAVDGYVYTFTTLTADKMNGWYFGGGPLGDLVCMDIKTGEVKWEAKTGNGSMILVDGCLVCLTYRGDLLLVKPSPTAYQLVTEIKGALKLHPWLHHKKPQNPGGDAAGAPCWVIPVAAHGKLYLRYDDELTCFDLMK